MFPKIEKGNHDCHSLTLKGWFPFFWSHLNASKLFCRSNNKFHDCQWVKMGTTWEGKKLSDFCTQYFMETWSSFNKPFNEFSAKKNSGLKKYRKEKWCKSTTSCCYVVHTIFPFSCCLLFFSLQVYHSRRTQTRCWCSQTTCCVNKCGFMERRGSQVPQEWSLSGCDWISQFAGVWQWKHSWSSTS